jgi:regulator of nucleoside diphosphate kinase
VFFGKTGRYDMNAMINGRRSGTSARGSPERPPIVLVAKDHERLHALLNSSSVQDSAVGRFLREELDRADIVTGDVASTSLVRMGCAVKFVDHASHHIRHARLVYPEEADSERCVSVLSPLGSALVGLGPGQSFRWVDHGKERRFTVLGVHPK